MRRLFHATLLSTHLASPVLAGPRPLADLLRKFWPCQTVLRLRSVARFSSHPLGLVHRKPLDVLTQNLCGKLFGDKGYLAQALFERLLEQGIELITTIRKNTCAPNGV